MRPKYFIIGVALVALSCGNGKGSMINEPYDGGHGIGIDTAKVNEIDHYEDSKTVLPSSSTKQEYNEPDNMRGFDPASEDDMDDNGMSRYMENNDEKGGTE